MATSPDWEYIFMLRPHRLPFETPDAHGPSKHVAQTRWTLPATILGSGLSFIDGSVVNVALPAMQKVSGRICDDAMGGQRLHVDARRPVLARRCGRRSLGTPRMFMIGWIGFAAASFGCGIAPSVGWLIAFGTVQGGAAALLVPASLALIGSLIRERARTGHGTWAASAALTTALGPVIGGWLVDAVVWRSSSSSICRSRLSLSHLP